MAEIGTATVKITPELDTEAFLGELNGPLRYALSTALRRLADEIGTPRRERETEPRYYAANINGTWGICDRRMPDEWAAYDDGADSEDLAKEGAAELNAEADERDDYWWTPKSEV